MGRDHYGDIGYTREERLVNDGGAYYQALTFTQHAPVGYSGHGYPSQPTQQEYYDPLSTRANVYQSGGQAGMVSNKGYQQGHAYGYGGEYRVEGPGPSTERYGGIGGRHALGYGRDVSSNNAGYSNAWVPTHHQPTAGGLPTVPEHIEYEM
ncbi:hypothetical protein M422DRAFT_276836 [Sphaerobolus stellatus SS14]|uniref:Uncharacterized protein n=1 Tax=Sphaerobolus stellatus (strain SS14) TaxID=990650 RepID=A0A0C9UB00_SPHS4|nr:hypothetical protein M422DRAFT_276834 [Sphaerobolus stellatus SS14]KIJ22703.1 hypothetical protein M422DRAFT_276836 [Sphaerobolus stellatus SS14]